MEAIKTTNLESITQDIEGFHKKGLIDDFKKNKMIKDTRQALAQAQAQAQPISNN